jgi:hypothetical protein
MGWSNTQVVASVGATAVSGIVKVEQNGTWSNALTFTVPPSLSGETQVTLVPDVMSMVVGDTRSMQALNSAGQSVTGLIWESSNPAVASLSTDDPPIITAVAVGNVTITAGSASADLTVYPGTTLAMGTIIWSNPGDGSGVQKIVPAVPSSMGLADVFALQADCNVQAIQSDGTVAWSSNIGAPVAGSGCKNFISDFQGGFVAQDPGNPQYANGNNLVNVGAPGSVQKFDGITGKPNPPYYVANPNQSDWSSSPSFVVHTDGTIFTIDGDSVVAIDPASGSQKFSAKMEHSTGVVSGCPSIPSFEALPEIDSNPMIAGDGYVYVVYNYGTSSDQGCPQYYGNYSEHLEIHLRMLRVGTGGDSSEIVIGDSSQDSTYATTNTDFGGGYSEQEIQTTAAGSQLAQFEELQRPITNADQGVILAAYAPAIGYCG